MSMHASWMALRTLGSDQSVKNAKLKPGTLKRIAGYASPYKTIFIWVVSGVQPNIVRPDTVKPSVEPNFSLLTKTPYKIIEKAKDNSPKNMARYLANKNPNKQARKPATIRNRLAPISEKRLPCVANEIIASKTDFGDGRKNEGMTFKDDNRSKPLNLDPKRGYTKFSIENQPEEGEAGGPEVAGPVTDAGNTPGGMPAPTGNAM